MAIVLRCTGKVLKELGIKKSGLSFISESQEPLKEWYVNLFYIDRKKCLIFTEAQSLFTFIVFGLYRKEIKTIEKVFRKGLSKILYYHNFNAKQINHILKTCDDFCFSTTISRKVLGSMNDMVFGYKNHLYLMEQITEEIEIDILRSLNDTPMGSIKYEFPIEVFTKYVLALFQNNEQALV